MRSVFYPRLVNGPFGDPGLYVRLAYRGEALLFDCGELHALAVRDLLKIRAVFVSHAHIDHLIGFDRLLRAFLYQQRRLLVCGPPGIVERIAGRLSGYTWNLIGGYPLVLTVREWGEDGGREVTFRAATAFRPEAESFWRGEGGLLLESGYCRVRGVPLEHGDIASMAFVLEEPLHVAVHKDGLERHGYRPGPWLTDLKDRLRQGLPAATPVAVPLLDGGEETVALGTLAERITHRERGMKIAYVTDAAPTAANLARIEDLAAEAHLLAIEATFPHRDLERARERGHLTARLAGDLARRAGAARLLTFHHSPRYQDEPEALSREAQAAFAGD